MSHDKFGTIEAPVEISDSDDEPRPWIPRSLNKAMSDQYVDLTRDDLSHSRPVRPPFQTLSAKRFYSPVMSQVTRPTTIPRSGDTRVVDQDQHASSIKNAIGKPAAKDPVDVNARPAAEDRINVTARPATNKPIISATRPVVEVSTGTAAWSVAKDIIVSTQPATEDRITARPTAEDSINVTARPTAKKPNVTTRPVAKDAINVTARPIAKDPISTTARPAAKDTINITPQPAAKDCITATRFREETSKILEAWKSTTLPSYSSSSENAFPINGIKARNANGVNEPSNPKELQTSSPPHTRVKHGNRDKSPRVAMAEAQRDSIIATESDTTTSLSIPEMEKILRGIAIEMANNHALFVKFQLQDARTKRNRCLETLPDFREDTEPFANMRSIAVSPASESTISVNHHFIKSGARRHTNIPVTLIPRTEERVPRFKHYIHINRSMLVGDARQLAYEPYLGDTGPDEEEARKKWLKEIRDAYGPAKDPLASRKTERVFRLREYLPRMLERVNLTMEQISSRNPLGLTTPTGRFSVAFTHVFHRELADTITETAPETTKSDDIESPRSIKSQSVEPSEKMLETYIVMTCSICGVNECGIHGEYESTYRKFNMSFRSLFARRLRRLPAQKSEEPQPHIQDSYRCSAECYLAIPVNEQAESWSSEDVANLKAFLVIMQQEPHPSCIIAPFLRKPCYQVYKRLAMLGSPVSSPKTHVKMDRRSLDWYDNKRKKINTDIDWGMKTKTHMHDKRGQPRGCEHFGLSCNEAGEKCTCLQDEILCDKFCACPDDCYVKFTGCNCHYPCSLHSGVCPCALLNRECDPDLCRDCKGCRNMSIQRGTGKPLIIGESSHPDSIGYGAYMAEPADKGEYVAEYVGEIITNEEAERRGLLYDELKMSFLFDLNADVVVDAYRFGNKTRFINHSSDYNCEAKIRLVNGEHRIGFFTTRAVDAGEELFFDYGKKFAEKHGLTDAVPAFLKESTRGRARARGGRGGRGGGRGRGTGRYRTPAATKFAPRSEPALNEEAEQVVAVKGAERAGEAEVVEEVDVEEIEEELLDIPIDQQEDTSYSESGDAAGKNEGDDEGEDSDEDVRARPRRQNVMTRKYTR